MVLESSQGHLHGALSGPVGADEAGAMNEDAAFDPRDGVKLRIAQSAPGGRQRPSTLKGVRGDGNGMNTPRSSRRVLVERVEKGQGDGQLRLQSEEMVRPGTILIQTQNPLVGHRRRTRGTEHCIEHYGASGKPGVDAALQDRLKVAANKLHGLQEAGLDVDIGLVPLGIEDVDLCKDVPRAMEARLDVGRIGGDAIVVGVKGLHKGLIQTAVDGIHGLSRLLPLERGRKGCLDYLPGKVSATE